MENKEQAQALEQEQAIESKETFNKDELLNQVREEVKSEIAGLNSKISELTKEKRFAEEAAIKEAESKMTVAERLAKIETDLESSRAETKASEQKAIMTKVAIKALEDSGLPSSAIEKIDLTSEETIAADIEFFGSMLGGVEQTAKDDLRNKYRFKPTGGEAKHSAPKSLKECKTTAEKVAYLKSKRE